MLKIAKRLLTALLWSVGCLLVVGILLVGGYSFDYLADLPPAYVPPNPPSQPPQRNRSVLAATDRKPSAFPSDDDRPPANMFARLIDDDVPSNVVQPSPNRATLVPQNLRVAQRPGEARMLQPDDDKDAEFEREAKTLATKFRTASTEEQTKIRQQLEAQIEKHFEHRQQQRKREIEELSSRLVSLGVAQQRRQENKPDILKRRLNDLLNPKSDLEWDDLRTKNDVFSGETREVDKARIDLDMAKFAEEFNELYAQQRYSDAEVIAKKARVLNPRDPTAVNMEQKARFARQNKFIEDKKRPSSEPTFQSIPLSSWLKRLEVARSLPELQKALKALQHLYDESEPQTFVRAVLGMSQSLPVLQDKINGHDITRESLVLLRSAPSDVVVDEILRELNKETTRRLTRGFKSLITTFIGSTCSLPNSESQYFGNYYPDVYVVSSNRWFLDYQPHSIESLRPEIRRQSRRLVNALVKIANHNAVENEWVIETSSDVLENSEQPLTSYPALIPVVEKVFAESNSRYTKGIAAVLLGGSDLRVPEVISYLKSSVISGLESRPDGSVYSPAYVTAIQQVARLSSHSPLALNILEEELTERCKEYESGNSGTIMRAHLAILLRGLGDVGDSAKGTLPLLHSIAASMPGNQGTFQFVINGRGFQVAGMDNELALAIKRIEDAKPKPKPEPLPEENSLGAEQSVPANTASQASTNSELTKPTTASNEAEPTFDGISYSAWMRMLETERKPEKLAMAVDACSQLAQPADERKIAKAIFRAAGTMEGSDIAEAGKVYVPALRALMRLPGEIVADEFLAALRDMDSYKRGRNFQALFLTQGLGNGSADFEASYQKRADDLISELMKLISSESPDADHLLAGASVIWQISKRPLDSFPSLKPILLKYVEDRQWNSQILKPHRYYLWQFAASRVVHAAPETTGLAMSFVHHLKTDLRQSKIDEFHYDLALLAQLKRHAEPAVPDLVEIFLDNWKQSIAQTRPSGDDLNSPYTNDFNIGIIRQLGNIGVGAKGFALLRELSIISPPVDRLTFDQSNVEFSKAVEEAIKSFKASDYPSPVRLLDDRSLIMGRWKVRTISPGTAKITLARIGPHKLDLCSQNGPHITTLQTTYTFEIDADKSPKQISLRFEETDPRQGLYELTETTLRIQFAQQGQPRPTSIAAKASDLPEGNSLIELERRSIENPVPNAKVSEEPKPAKKAGLFANAISNDFEYAWQSKDPYSPPDSDKFFPDDAEAGHKLDALFSRGQPAFEPNEEVLLVARNGLRRTKVRRDFVVRWVGNSYIWGKAEQSPDAIELTYHAADFKGPDANPFRTRHFAVYFGLSLVERKTPAILRTLVDLCLKVDDPNDLSRVAWGIGNQQDQLLAVLKPHLASDDTAVRDKAQVLEKIFTGQLKAFAWAADEARKRSLEKYGDELPKFKTELSEGSSEARSNLLEKILTERISLIMDDTFIPAFENAAKDSNVKVRNTIAIIAGDRWVWSAEQQNPEAIKLMLELSRDVDAKVRYNAVYYGLSTVQKKDDDVVRRMLELALDDRGNSDILGRIKWGMQNDKHRTKALLKEWIDGPDETRATNARTHYKDLTGEDAPTAEK